MHPRCAERATTQRSRVRFQLHADPPITPRVRSNSAVRLAASANAHGRPRQSRAPQRSTGYRVPDDCVRDVVLDELGDRVSDVPLADGKNAMETLFRKQREHVADVRSPKRMIRSSTPPRQGRHDVERLHPGDRWRATNRRRQGRIRIVHYCSQTGGVAGADSLNSLRKLAPQAGFEPATLRLTE